MPSSHHQIRFVLIVSLVITNFISIRAAELEPSQVSPQYKLEEFIEESLAQIDGTGHFEENLSENVDTIAQYLNIGSDQSEVLQQAIAEAVNIRELLEEDAGHDDTIDPTTSNPTSNPTNAAPTASSRFVPPSRSPGLKGVLDSDETNPHIVHAKRSIDLDSLTNTTLTLLHTLPRYEQKFLEEVSQEVVGLEDSGEELDVDDLEPTTDVIPRGSPIRGLKRLAVSIWQRGTGILDSFYEAPEFIMKAPILGKYIRDLKKKCEPIYKTVKFLRHSVYLLKFIPKRNGLKNLTNYERYRIKEAKKMISDVGASALKTLSFKIIAKYARRAVSEEATKEFITRAFYAILGHLLSIDKPGGFFKTGFKYIFHTFRMSCRMETNLLPSLGI